MATTALAAPAPPKTAEERRRGSDFAPLLADLKTAGLLDRRPLRYALSIGTGIALLLGTFVGVVLLGDTWWQLALALPAALFGVRAMFVGHDAGHRQIGRSHRTDRAMALLHGNLLMGMSSGWWIAKHNRHHANPNHLDKDPDVRAGVLVWDAGQAASRRGFAGWLTRHQARLFLPLLLLEGLNLKIGSIVDLRNRSRAERRVEGALIAANVGLYFGVLFSAMSPGKAIAFFLLQHALMGVHLGLVFAPNHKGMPMPGPGEKWDHLRRQVLTSRNVRGGRVTDWLMGGLNYQIEHHLVPNMPRFSLRRAQPIVRAHCARLGVPYLETGAVESYRQALSHMHKVGAGLRTSH